MMSCFVCLNDPKDDFSVQESHKIVCSECGNFEISREALDDIKDERKNREASLWIKANGQDSLITSETLYEAGILSLL